MILVTGAAGKTGQAVLRALSRQGAPTRALVRRAQQVSTVRQLGAADVLVGDMRDPAMLREAVDGTLAIYHICPNMHPEELAIGLIALNAAKAATTRHFVYHSVLHPQTEAMPHHWHKLRVEEMLLEAGIPFTIVQPAAYMQNILSQWDRIVRDGVYAVPYAIHTRLGMVDLQDVATAAAVILTAGSHDGATYELAGREILTQVEVAVILERRLQRSVRAQAIPLTQWRAQALLAGLGAYQVETLCKMFRYYEDHGFWGNPNVLTWLLGRPPTSFAAFVDRVARGVGGLSERREP